MSGTAPRHCSASSAARSSSVSSPVGAGDGSRSAMTNPSTRCVGASSSGSIESSTAPYWRASSTPRPRPPRDGRGRTATRRTSRGRRRSVRGASGLGDEFVRIGVGDLREPLAPVAQRATCGASTLAARSGLALGSHVVAVHRPNASNSTSSTAIRVPQCRPARGSRRGVLTGPAGGEPTQPGLVTDAGDRSRLR